MLCQWICSGQERHQAYSPDGHYLNEQESPEELRRAKGRESVRGRMVSSSGGRLGGGSWKRVPWVYYLWNSLPREVVELLLLKSFKTGIIQKVLFQLLDYWKISWPKTVSSKMVLKCQIRKGVIFTAVKVFLSPFFQAFPKSSCILYRFSLGGEKCSLSEISALLWFAWIWYQGAASGSCLLTQYFPCSFKQVILMAAK